ncbi:hypothetical protein Hanom_Chr08g00709921 [Helianthus anomalus]
MPNLGVHSGFLLCQLTKQRENRVWIVAPMAWENSGLDGSGNCHTSTIEAFIKRKARNDSVKCMEDVDKSDRESLAGYVVKSARRTQGA